MSFSFKFWRQTTFFAVDRVPDGWFVALLQKLGALSAYTLDEFLESGPLRSAWHFHTVDWDQRNIPIQRHHCEWVPRSYLENEIDFPFYQFQITQGLGRFSCFLDEQSVFNVVLLDPFHNLQPTQSHGYQVQPTKPLSCVHTSLLDTVDRILAKAKLPPDARASLLAEHKKSMSFSGVLLGLTQQQVADAYDLVAARQANSLNEIFEFGLLEAAAAPQCVCGARAVQVTVSWNVQLCDRAHEAIGAPMTEPPDLSVVVDSLAH